MKTNKSSCKTFKPLAYHCKVVDIGKNHKKDILLRLIWYMYKERERDAHNSQHTQFMQDGPFPDVKNDV